MWGTGSVPWGEWRQVKVRKKGREAKDFSNRGKLLGKKEKGEGKRKIVKIPKRICAKNWTRFCGV